MDREAKLAELAALQSRVAELETELGIGPHAPGHWQATDYYGAYYATTGLMLGMVAASVSLLFNVIGSLAWSHFTGDDLHPLQLIQVYLTFPLGANALEISQGLTLAIGCCLYLFTGAVYGMIIQVVLTRLFAQASGVTRLIVTSLLAVAIWVVNFYGILYWLQPALFGGNWIVELVPWWVAGLTHLVFGWTMWLIYPLGLYTPYRPPTAEHH